MRSIRIPGALLNGGRRLFLGPENHEEYFCNEHGGMMFFTMDFCEVEILSKKSWVKWV